MGTVAPRRASVACAVFGLLLSSAISATASAQEAARQTARQPDQTALDRYVATPDPAYKYDVVETVQGEGFTAHAVHMTSQKWLTAQEVDDPVWRHWMWVIVPKRVTTNKALLLISGGSREQKAPRPVDKMLPTIALATGSVVAELRQVPSQPLLFAGETKGRVEDELIAYTWDKYLRTGDERWPARLPMTKAAVRAMDTVTALCASDRGGRQKVDSFVVSGGSKRGWTAWMTAAVDKRVVAVAPIVIDTLNVEESGAHHFRAYGFFAPALNDYVEMKIPDWAGTPQYKALLKIEEPYEYRHRLTMPKFILNATGDQYFPPDNSRFYFDDLPGVKYLRYVPNADHSLKDTDAPETLLACYSAVVRGTPLPKFTWTTPADGRIRVESKDPPARVLLWQATNPKARDFRLETIGKAWTSAPLAESTRQAGVYEATVAKPGAGWTAFFVELTYRGPEQSGPPLKFTTPVSIVPDVLPYKFPPEDAPAGK